MIRLDDKAQAEVNVALRMAVGDCLATGIGGIDGVWDWPDRLDVEPMPDLAFTFFEHRAAGLEVAEALRTLAAEVAANSRQKPERHLVGIGLVGHAPLDGIGMVATCAAVVDGKAHLITWPSIAAIPFGEVIAMTSSKTEGCTAILAALQQLLDALAGPNAGGAR